MLKERFTLIAILNIILLFSEAIVSIIFFKKQVKKYA